MAQTVADVLVGVLERVGVSQIFGLIGDSLNPLADSVRHSPIEWIGVRHEEGAALAAAGQAKLTGRLAVYAGTTGRAATIWRGPLRGGTRSRPRARNLRRHAAQAARH
jgi:pyruvate dehydrogenase (quinone)